MGPIGRLTRGIIFWQVHLSTSEHAVVEVQVDSKCCGITIKPKEGIPQFLAPQAIHVTASASPLTPHLRLARFIACQKIGIQHPASKAEATITKILSFQTPKPPVFKLHENIAKSSWQIPYPGGFMATGNTSPMTIADTNMMHLRKTCSACRSRKGEDFDPA
jgi:hypothetical protein